MGVTLLHSMRVASIVLALASPTIIMGNEGRRDGKIFSLFSIVQFPNEVCTSLSSSTTNGTCYTSSECSSKGGSADGNCAAGFGVCCAISTNTSYIRNPGYPSSYTPTGTGTCSFTINKCSSDICQLRLDFQTMTGFVTSTANVGSCTDSFAVASPTGSDPPTICGTNTVYHMYSEFGASDTDTLTLTITYGDTTTGKTFNILMRQIACTASWRAPTDCTQYFTGTAGTVQTYNFGQLLRDMYYTNCLRTEAGYCGVQWKQSTGTTPDAFQMTASGTTNAEVDACGNGFIFIPNLSPDGIVPLAIPDSNFEFISTVCGGAFGIDGKAVPLALVTRDQPFVMGVFTDTTATTATSTGASLDYTQVPC